MWLLEKNISALSIGFKTECDSILDSKQISKLSSRTILHSVVLFVYNHLDSKHISKSSSRTIFHSVLLLILWPFTIFGIRLKYCAYILLPILVVIFCFLNNICNPYFIPNNFPYLLRVSLQFSQSSSSSYLIWNTLSHCSSFYRNTFTTLSNLTVFNF